MHGSWLRTVCSQRHWSSSSPSSRPLLDHAAKVGLDRELVLRGRRHDAGPKDGPVLGDLVAVEEQAPGCLGDTGAHAGYRIAPRRTSTAGGSGGAYDSTSASASSQANTNSTERTTMLWKGFEHTGPSPPAAAAWAAIGGRVSELSA